MENLQGNLALVRHLRAKVEYGLQEWAEGSTRDPEEEEEEEEKQL